MKKITIDYSVSPVAISDRILGNQGEALATELEITLPDEMINDGSIAEFCGAFGSCNGVFHSKRVTKSEIADGVLLIPITAEISSNLTVSFQIEAFSSDDSLIMKTSLIEGLTFNKSVCRNHSDLSKLIDPADLANITAEIKANTLARHIHSNTDTLNKLGDSNGSLTYDGKAVGGGNETNVVILTAQEWDIETSMNQETCTFVFAYNTNKIPENAEIANVEIKVGTDDGGNPIWKSVKDSFFDSNDSPFYYYSNRFIKRNFLSFGDGYILFSVYSPSTKNNFILELEGYVFTDIRVRYYI